MMNYIKSEFYRITHTKAVYAYGGILVLLVVLFNIATGVLGGQYAITSFSYSNLVANPMIFSVMGAVTVFILYEGNRKNGNLKNTISGGISRRKIFAGECIVSLTAATVVMAAVLTAWILSAELFLERTGPVKLKDLLMGIPAVYLIAAAGLVSCVLFLGCFEKDITGILVWYVVWLGAPTVLLYAGRRIDGLFRAALWLPANLFGINAQNVNMSECITVWDTAEGMARCVVSGAAGVAVFALIGALILRRRDL